MVKQMVTPTSTVTSTVTSTALVMGIACLLHLEQHTGVEVHRLAGRRVAHQRGPAPPANPRHALAVQSWWLRTDPVRSPQLRRYARHALPRQSRSSPRSPAILRSGDGGTGQDVASATRRCCGGRKPTRSQPGNAGFAWSGEPGHPRPQGPSVMLHH